MTEASESKLVVANRLSWRINQIFPEPRDALKRFTAVGWAVTGIACMHRFRVIGILTSRNLLNRIPFVFLCISVLSLALACVYISQFNDGEPISPIMKSPASRKAQANFLASAPKPGTNEKGFFTSLRKDYPLLSISLSVACFPKSTLSKLASLVRASDETVRKYQDKAGLFNSFTVVKNPFAIPLAAHLAAACAISFLASTYVVYGMFALPLGIIVYCGLLNVLELLAFFIKPLSIRILVIIGSVIVPEFLLSSVDTSRLKKLTPQGSLIAWGINAVSFGMCLMYALFTFICFFRQLVPEKYLPYFTVKWTRHVRRPALNGAPWRWCISTVEVLTTRPAPSGQLEM